MNILLNKPSDYHECNNLNENEEFKIRKEENITKEESVNFWREYYVKQNKYNESMIKIHDDIIPLPILQNINNFCTEGVWKYNYSPFIHPEETEYTIENIPEPIKCFSMNVINNRYFKSLFFNSILPKINIPNSDELIIDRAFITGQLHGLSQNFHKDERSSIKYGPSVYVFLNKLWKPYYDGSLVFILDDNEPTNTAHVENNYGRMVIFPPNIYHKTCEISAYGLVENAFSSILQYHLIYK